LPTNTVEGYALIDTGAFISCIEEEAARKLGLSAVDVVNMTSASHESTEVNVYAARIEIVAGQLIQFDLPRVLGVNLRSQRLMALIGRDILAKCTLFYNGMMGQITLSI
jgi:predicted aspartyl protease